MGELMKPNGLTPLLSKSLGSQDLAKHRAMVAVELEVLAKKFDRFGWERDRNSPAHDRMVTDWMDVLQDYPLAEVRAACRRLVLENPAKMPNEGHVRAEIVKERGKHIRRDAEVSERRERVSKDAAAAILADVGFKPKTFGGNK